MPPGGRQTVSVFSHSGRSLSSDQDIPFAGFLAGNYRQLRIGDPLNKQLQDIGGRTVYPRIVFEYNGCLRFSVFH